MLSIARQILRYRSLLATLTARELKARYRGSVLGFFWSLINPLLLLGVYSLVFGLILTPERGQGIEPYPLYLVAGLFPWIWFQTSLLEGSASLTGNAGLIRKAAFPAELLPMVSVLSNLVHLLFALPIIAGALAVGRFLGYPVAGWASLSMVLVVVVQLPMVAGLALALSAITAHFKDMRDLLNNLLTLLFFTTPIIYPLAAIPFEWLRSLVRANPLALFTVAYQQTLFEGRLPSLALWGAMALVSGLSWCLGAWLFERLRETLVEAV